VDAEAITEPAAPPAPGPVTGGDGRPGTERQTAISVVVPLCDEERSIGPLYAELAAALGPLQRSWEAIFVDDGSTDGSFAALTRLHASEPNVRVVRMRRNFGKAAALAAGFDQAGGEIVVTIDGDLQDDPAEIPRLLAKLDEGFDLVSGWKARRRDPPARRILSRIFNTVTSWTSGVRLHDMNCGLKAYRAEVVQGLRIYGELHRFIPVLAHYRGYRIAELPVHHRPREHGRSRYGLERYLRGFLDLLTVSFIGRYRQRPLHLFGGLGLLLSLGGLGTLVYLTASKATGHAIGQRPLLTLGVLLVVVGLQFLSLGLIGEMILSQHEERAGDRGRSAPLVDDILD
jgi:glycosyltransferase involved in cell wall biosynthesis